MKFLLDYTSQLQDTIAKIDIARIQTVIDWFREARSANRTVFVCGNGGSAATASHFACDIVKGASFQRESRFRIMALTDSLATLTAYSNDVGYEHVFAEQLRNFATAGDLVLAISGSGNSPNVIRAVEHGNRIGCKTISLTGRDGGKLGALSHLDIRVPVPHMGRIEDAHMIVCHMIAYYFMEAEHNQEALHIAASNGTQLKTLAAHG